MRPSSTRRMPPSSGQARVRWLGVLAALLVLAVPRTRGGRGDARQATVTRLRADEPHLGHRRSGEDHDPNLVNPWGMAAGPTTPLWVSDNGADVSTLYTAAPGSIPVACHWS